MENHIIGRSGRTLTNQADHILINTPDAVEAVTVLGLQNDIPTTFYTHHENLVVPPEQASKVFAPAYNEFLHSIPGIKGITTATQCDYNLTRIVHGDITDKTPVGQLHRHRATFSIRVNVHHADREIEYFELRRFCMSILPGDTHAVGDTSLENLGENLLGKLVQQYPNRSWEIRVLEDAENGAVIQYKDAA